MYNCVGRGYNMRNKSRYKWSYSTKKYELEFYSQQQKCDKCKGNGKILDKQATQIKKQQYEKQQQYKQFVNKENKFQEFLNKQKKFEEQFKQNQINKPLLQGIQVDSQQNYSNRWSKIQRQSILSTQKSKGIIYCGVCAGTGYQRKYLSQQINICSNCKGSGKMNLNQDYAPEAVLLKPQIKNKIEKKAKKGYSEDKLIFCGNCGGKGYEKIYMSNQTKKCQICGGIGKLVLDSSEFPQKIKYQSQEQQAKIILKNYQKMKKNQIKRIKQNQSVQRRIKTQGQLREQFQRKYAEQKKQKQRKQHQKHLKQQQRIQKRLRQENQKKRQQKQQRNRQWQQYLKTPEGIEYIRKRKMQEQKQAKRKKRFQRIQCCVKICCCGRPSCGRISIWCGIIFIISIWIVIWMIISKSRS